VKPDIGSESRFLPILPAFDALIRGFPVRILPWRLVWKKLKRCGYPMVKNLKICLFPLTECTNVTHTHTQTHTAWWHRPCLHSIARLKPTYSKKQSKKQATLVDLAWKRGQWPAKFTNKLHSTKLRTFNLKMKQLLCIQIFTMYKKLSIIHSVVNLPQTHIKVSISSNTTVQKLKNLQKQITSHGLQRCS